MPQLKGILAPKPQVQDYPNKIELEFHDAREFSAFVNILHCARSKYYSGGLECQLANNYLKALGKI